MEGSQKRGLLWVSGSKSDFKALPLRLQKQFDVALDIVQQGLTPDGTKALKGKQKGAIQLSEDHDGNTYRSVYTAELEHAVYVCTASREVEDRHRHDMLIETRLKAARTYDAQLVTLSVKMEEWTRQMIF